VYSVVPCSALLPLAAEQGAVLACGPRVVLSHRSAAQVWGLLEPVDGPVEVTVVGSDAGRWRPKIDAHRIRELQRIDVRRRQGLPITAPALTVIDVAATASIRRAELALDRALTHQLVSRTAVCDATDRHRTRPGVRLVRALLESDRPSSVTVSPPEERLRALCRRGGLPEPEVNVPIGDPFSRDPVQRYRPDLMWRKQRVAVEYHSFDYHGGRRAFYADDRRHEDLRRAGWVVVYVTWDDLENEPERVLVAIAMALARTH
jgi:hypothetical protein